MIKKLISDCEQALNHNLYFAALCLSLVLVDVCAKAEYPEEKNNKKRYVDWFEKHIEPNGEKLEQVGKEQARLDPPYLCGEYVYNLRCFMLHQGTPNIDEQKYDINKFEMLLEQNPSFVFSSTANTKGDRALAVNIKGMCMEICAVAKGYYEKNKDAFNFFNYHLTDL